MNYIHAIITTKPCDSKDALIGFFRNGHLDINISRLPKLIYILTDKPFSANQAELCLGLLCEKLCACEELIMNQYVLRYHNHSATDYFIGGLVKEALDECFNIISYNVTYSLHDLI